MKFYTAAMLAIVAALAFGARPSQAQYAAQLYPYCSLSSSSGATSCYYRSRFECPDTCIGNPWYIGVQRARPYWEGRRALVRITLVRDRPGPQCVTRLRPSFLPRCRSSRPHQAARAITPLPRITRYRSGRSARATLRPRRRQRLRRMASRLRDRVFRERRRERPQMIARRACTPCLPSFCSRPFSRISRPRRSAKRAKGTPLCERTARDRPRSANNCSEVMTARSSRVDGQK